MELNYAIKILEEIHKMKKWIRITFERNNIKLCAELIEYKKELEQLLDDELDYLIPTNELLNSI